MSHDWSSRAGSAGPSNLGGGGAGSRSFLSRLSAAPTESQAGYSAFDDAMDQDPDDGQGQGQGQGQAPNNAATEPSVFTDEDLAPPPEEAELDDVRRLARVWVRERGVPAILGWEGELVDSVLDKLEQQQKMITTLRADPTTSEEEHFRLVLVQTEMERAKYLVRSYVRVRLHKIEKHAQHIVATDSLHTELSGAELQHARKYAELLTTHFQHSVLDSLPEWLRGMDDTGNDGVSMVSKPNLDTPVVIYCNRDCGQITLERGTTTDLEEGTTHLVRYNLVERWINLGWAEVL